MPMTLTLRRKSYVVLEEAEYRHLARLKRLPPLPEPNERGNYPAVPAAHAIIARGIIIDRSALGLSQKDLAGLAGIRVETLNRIEKARVTPDTATIVKIDRALKRAQASAANGTKARSVAKRSKRAAKARR